MGVFVALHEGEQHAEQHGQNQTVDQALAVVVQQSVVRPGHAGAREQKDDGVVERQVPGIENLNALRRPDATGIGGACGLDGLAGKQAGIEEGPEPGDEEHHFRSDEHDHAVAQVQRDHAGMVALMGFLHRVRPPSIHRVEHDQKTDEEDPRRGEIDAEQVEGATRDVTHVADAAERHDERANGGEKRPRAGVDDVVVVFLLVRIGHVIVPECIAFCPRHSRKRMSFKACLRHPSCYPQPKPPASTPHADRRYRTA